ncbi:hypothetical protein [Arthrobacter sp. lap29]|uniref:hypothetical protein n=1 Tax=Arthrobacter sp. lap29 TaxID=3056122 RepID=UPI0028F6FCD4|nr:hypothetical protein [Arthrobacter sp. lap29]
MRSALVYALLTGCIMAVYAAVLAVAAARLTGDPVTALVAAALIAVGISPPAHQRAVDRFLYGKGADPCPPCQDSVHSPQGPRITSSSTL